MLYSVLQEQVLLPSEHLDRMVTIECFLPGQLTSLEGVPLLLINDGQDMETMGFKSILERLYEDELVSPVLFVAIHASADRKMEYGTARQADYLGRGAKAQAYTLFILDELLPHLRQAFNVSRFHELAFAGFSLGGLSALDIVWEHPELFSTAAVFSGSLWWRQRGLDDGYEESRDRIMHKLIRAGHYHPGLKFFFSTGSLDETADRNNNGIIDSIDDSLGVIEELVKKGYSAADDIRYINYEDGKHDVQTWGRAMPEFLKWKWGTPLGGSL